MKKLISLLLVIALSASLAACGSNTDTETPEVSEGVVETGNTDIEETPDIEEEDAEAPVASDEEAPEEAKPAEKPAEEQKPSASKPTEKPAEQKPAEKPTESKPVEEKPAEEQKPAEQAPATLGNKLLATFNANAATKSGEELANILLSIPEIQFAPAVAPMEEGYLNGFSNAEITGFKSATMFAPMIGAIPFVGYIFELESASEVPAFITMLKQNANLRWNVCSEADEMITGSHGNKVFFVMCPTSIEE